MAEHKGYVVSSCKVCNEDRRLEVLHTPPGTPWFREGFYLGTKCSCGYYSRQTGYYKAEISAKNFFSSLLEYRRKVLEAFEKSK